MLELPESLCEEVEELDAGSEVVLSELLFSGEEVVSEGAGEDATRVEGLELWEEGSWTVRRCVWRVAFL